MIGTMKIFKEMKREEETGKRAFQFILQGRLERQEIVKVCKLCALLSFISFLNSLCP